MVPFPSWVEDVSSIVDGEVSSAVGSGVPSVVPGEVSAAVEEVSSVVSEEVTRTRSTFSYKSQLPQIRGLPNVSKNKMVSSFISTSRIEENYKLEVQCRSFILFGIKTT